MPLHDCRSDSALWPGTFVTRLPALIILQHFPALRLSSPLAARETPLHNAVIRTSGESSTCIIRPSDLHACLSRALLLLRALGGMPVHNGRQPLVDAGVAVVLHMRHVQKCQRTCGM